jgi:hypothetical protein
MLESAQPHTPSLHDIEDRLCMRHGPERARWLIDEMPAGKLAEMTSVQEILRAFREPIVSSWRVYKMYRNQNPVNVKRATSREKQDLMAFWREKVRKEIEQFRFIERELGTFDTALTHFRN